MSFIKIAAIKGLNSFASVVSQTLALAIAKRVLLKPKKVCVNWPKDIKKVMMQSSQGDLATYKYGKGKDVWVIHHWSKSSYDLLPLIRKLARQGFCVHALDLPAHGDSEGTYANLFTMSQAFDDFAHGSLMPHTIITHGLGAAVVTNSKFFKRFTKNFVMLNPRLNTVNVMQKVAARYGVADETLSLLLKQLQRSYGVNLSNLDGTDKLLEFSGHVKRVEEVSKLSTFSLVKQLA